MSKDVSDPNLEYHPFKDQRSDQVMTRERSLSEDEFERLLSGAQELDDLYDLEAQFIILLAGRLGLRKGEIAHMKKSWVDLDEQVVSIPKHEACQDGRDGGLCGYCKNNAKQMADHNDIDLDTAAEFFWKAKTEKAERQIPYHFDEKCTDILEEFFGRFDEYYNSPSSITRRLERSLEYADGLEKGDTTMHGLRGTAASNLVALGLNSWSLQHFMGWAWPNTAQHYVRDDAKQLSATLDNLG